jgi:DNA topoisomerase-2
MISLLKKEVATLSNKARFIKMVIEDELVIKKKKRAVLVNELYELKFDTQTMLNEKKQKTKEELHKELELQNSVNNVDDDNSINVNEGNNNSENEDEQKNNKKNDIKPKVPIKEYDYLLSMNLWSLTQEKIEELLKQKELKEKELATLEQTEVETLWDNDLDNLEEELTKYEAMEEEDRLLAQKLNKGKSGAIPKKRRGGGRKKKNSEKSEDNNSQNDNDENIDSNDASSMISDSTNIITKKTRNKNGNPKAKTKTKTKTKKEKKQKQASLNDFIKEKSETSSNNGQESSDNDNNNNDEDNDNSSESNIFKIPLKERLKKKIVNIGESPIPLDNLSYGPSGKKELSDDSFSDFDLSYLDEKEKIGD